CHQVEVATTGACAGITAARWAEVEPDNAVPWTLVASEAAGRGDEEARGVAMAHAAAAQRFDHHAEELLRPVATASVQGANRLDQLEVSGAAMGVYAAVPLLDYQEIARYCGKGAIDANRRGSCGQLANQMVDKDRSVLGLRYAISIGERVGWSAERIAALKDERDAMHWMSLDERFMPESRY